MCGVSVGGGVEGRSVSGVEMVGGSVLGVVSRVCVVGDGFHALHWKMFSWCGCRIDGLRGLSFGRVGRVVVDGWIVCLGRVRVGWGLNEWESRMGMSCSLGIFGGCCGSVVVWGGIWVWLLGRVEGLLRVVGLFSFRVGGVVWVGVGCVCVLRLVCVLGAFCGVVARVWTRSVTNGSSSPVMMYLRWDLESDSACCWVWMSVGIRPWYMVVRLVRSMYMPHVHPSVCRGVLWTMVCGASLRRRGGAIYRPMYHCRRVLRILSMAGGSWRLRES